VKAQIHAGGRGKGRFKELGESAKGGVRLAHSIDEVREHAAEMLGKTLVTIQTGAAGKQVQRLYITDGVDISKEFYLALLVDRETGRIAVVASTEGGMDIETVAHDTPEKISTITIDPATGLMPHHGRDVAAALGLSGDLAKQAAKVLASLYQAFLGTDASQIEINPLAIDDKGRLLVLIDLGGNWCGDCRILAATMALPEMKRFIDRHFELVSVDVGRFDKNLQIPARYGITNRLEGVPALLVVDPKTGRQLVGRRQVADLADARHMRPQALADWIAQWTR
jgi:thiol-disulfide isomerase/thioredoxin